MSETDLYETDFVLWSESQGRRLRAVAAERPNADIDWENIAEEIEALARSERRETASLVSLILLHLLKIEVSPAIEPRRGSVATVVRSQRGLARRLAESPSLRPILPTVISEEWPSARTQATVELEEYAEFDAASIARRRDAFTPSEVVGDPP